VYTEDAAYSSEFHRIDDLVHILLETINADCIPIDGTPMATNAGCGGETDAEGAAFAMTAADGGGSDVLCGYSRLEEISEVIHQSGAYMHKLGGLIQQANTNRY
jgi:hypothetical protein